MTGIIEDFRLTLQGGAIDANDVELLLIAYCDGSCSRAISINMTGEDGGQPWGAIFDMGREQAVAFHAALGAMIAVLDGASLWGSEKKDA